jgi:hypothetical protein
MKGILTQLPNGVPTNGSQAHPYMKCPAGDCSFNYTRSLSTTYECETVETWSDTEIGCVYTYPRNASPSVLDAEPDLVYDSVTSFKKAITADHGTLYNNSSAICRNVGYGAPEREAVWTVQNGIGPQRKFWIEWPWSDRTLMSLSTGIIDVHGVIEDQKFPDYVTLEHWKGVTLSRQHCRVNFSSTLNIYSRIQNGDITIIDRNEEVEFSRDCPGCNILVDRKWDHNTKAMHRMSTDSRRRLSQTLLEVGNNALSLPLMNVMLVNQTTEDIARLFSSTISTFLQSESNVNLTRSNGTAYGSETYVRVRWQWMIMPCFIVAASAVFLLSTIFESRNKEQRFRSSILTGFFNGLSGFSEDDLRAVEGPLGNVDNDQDLKKRAKNARVKLVRSEAGKLSFAKKVR